MSDNLIEAIQKEIERNQELLNIYESIPTGAFGAAVIRKKIKDANNAVATNNIAAMTHCLQELRNTD